METNAGREMGLQRLLTEEHSRLEQCKQIYQTLKEQHQQLQDELTVIHEQLKESNQGNENIKKEYDSYVKMLEEKVKQLENENKRLQEELASHNLDDFKVQIIGDTAKIYDLKLEKVQEEANDERHKFNDQSHECVKLKCQLELVQVQHTSEIELLNAEHKRQIEALKFKISEYEKLSGPVEDNSQKLKSVEDELMVLRAKLKIVQDERDELITEREQESLNHQIITKNQEKQLLDYSNKIRNLESDSSNLLKQQEATESDLHKSQEDRIALTSEVQKLKQEISDIKIQFEHINREKETMITSFKCEMQVIKMSHETERGALENELQRLKQIIIQCENEKQCIILEKERELEKEISLMRQKHFEERSEIEEALDKANSEITYLCRTRENEKRDYEFGLAQLKEELELLSKKMSTKNSKIITELEIEDQSIEKDNFTCEKLIKQNSELRDEIEKLRSQVTELRSDERIIDLGGYNSHTYLRPPENVNTNGDLDFKLNAQREKYEFQNRITSLELHIQNQSHLWENEKQSMLNKQNKYSRLITKLRDQISSLDEAIEEKNLQVEKLNGESYISMEKHLTIKNKLKDIQRRQEEFGHLVTHTLSFLQVNDNVVPLSNPLSEENYKSESTFSEEVHGNTHYFGNSYPSSSYSKLVLKQQLGKGVKKELTIVKHRHAQPSSSDTESS